jgi:hypothetical protein
LTIPPPLALPKGKKRFVITSRKNKKKKSRKGKDILFIVFRSDYSLLEKNISAFIVDVV